MNAELRMRFDTAVMSMTAQGIPLEKAEAAARVALGITPEQWQARVEKDARVDEKKEQHECWKVFRAAGYEVYNLSQARASKQTPGLPDLWLVHGTRPEAFWFETKRQVGGELSKAQVEFRKQCLRAGVHHFYGDRFEAQRIVAALGAGHWPA